MVHVTSILFNAGIKVSHYSVSCVLVVVPLNCPLDLKKNNSVCLPPCTQVKQIYTQIYSQIYTQIYTQDTPSKAHNSLILHNCVQCRC